MPFTPAEIEAYRLALLNGEKKVTYADKTVEYNSLKELREQYEWLVAQSKTAVRKTFATYKNGL